MLAHPYRVVAAWVWFGLVSAAWLSSPAVAIAAAVFLLLAFAARSKKSGSGVAQIRLFAAVFSTGAAVLLSAGITFAAIESLDLPSNSYRQVRLSGEVLEQPRLLPDSSEWIATVRADSIDGAKLSRLDLQLRGLPTGQLRVKSQIAPELRQGDRFEASGIVVASSESAAKGRIRFALRAKEIQIRHSEFGSWLTSARSGFGSLATSELPAGSALVLGLTTGDTSRMSQSLLDQMKQIGLTHLVAVSGANCAIVLAAVLLPLSRTRIRRSIRVAICLAALVAYVAVVGPQPSVLRASVMMGFVFVATSVGRRVNPLDAVSLAVLALLLIDPWLSVEAGFALSVLATVALLSLAPAISQRLQKRLPEWLSLPIALVIATQLLCLPILVSLGSKLGIATIFANLIAAPLVAPVTILGMASFLLSLFGLPMANLVFAIASFIATPITGLAQVFDKPGLVGVNWVAGPAGVVLAISVSIGFVIWLLSPSSRHRRIAATISAAALACVSAAIASQNPFLLAKSIPAWSVFSCDIGQGDAYVLKSAGQIAVIDAGPDPQKIDDCLTTLQIDRIDLFVSTHFDRDHIGGLEGVLKGRDIDTAMVTSFADTRPAAKASEERIRAAAVQIIEPSAGQRGSFGNGSYLILNPASPNDYYEDANDASISMVFWFDGLQLLLLADLGETGQMRIAPLLLSVYQNQPCSILKVAHHGSANFYQELYQELHFDLAMISVGAGNGYGHPTRRALDTLAQSGIPVARTDRNGWLAARCESSTPNGGKTLTVTAQR